MDNHGIRELNDQLNLVRSTARVALGDAERAANGSHCHTVRWVEQSAKRAWETAQKLHDTFYDWDLHQIMEDEEEEESRQEELADYVNRVHKAITGR